MGLGADLSKNAAAEAATATAIDANVAKMKWQFDRIRGPRVDRMVHNESQRLL